MSFLCTTRNKEVSYHQCINECQYVFKSACIDKMNESYNQALKDLLNKVVCLRVYDNDLCLEDLIKAKEELWKR